LTASEVLQRCQLQGITVTPTPRGTLKVRGPRLPAELVEAVRVLKPEILRLLRDDEATTGLAEVYSRTDKQESTRVRIEPVRAAGLDGEDAFRLVDASTAEPLRVGLFATERWALAWCAEHDLTVEEATKA
jgi:hypothetical protein